MYYGFGRITMRNPKEQQCRLSFRLLHACICMVLIYIYIERERDTSYTYFLFICCGTVELEAAPGARTEKTPETCAADATPLGESLAL